MKMLPEFDPVSGSWKLVSGDERSARHVSRGGGEVLTQQHFAEEVDVNTIVRRFGITRSMPLGPSSGVYGDFTGISDFESAVERIEGARERFMKLPPEVRERFGNDPGRLIGMAAELPEDEFVRRFEISVAPEVP